MATATQESSSAEMTDPRGRRRSERIAYWFLAGVLLSHVAHELLWAPQGVIWETRLSGAVVPGVLAACAGLAFASTRTWLQSGWAAVLAALATAHGATHWVHATREHVDTTDVTGVGMLAAGAAMLLLAGELLIRRRRSARGRWPSVLKHGGVVMGAAAAGVVVLVPIAIGTVQVNLPRGDVAPAPDEDFGTTRLHSADGVRLAAWYRPSTNGAAVVLVSSARGDHSTVREHARMLAAHGYGVLVFDARGSGGSEGTPNGWGWSWLADVEAAIDFVLVQPDVDRGVALLGLSTGADVALEVAARDPRVRGLVADGATAQGFSDRPAGLLSAVTLWPMYATARVLTGVPELPPLEDAAAALGSRPALLVAAGSIPQEIPLNERYARAGGPSLSLWTLPTTGHTRAIHEHRTEYEQRVVGVFREAFRVLG